MKFKQISRRDCRKNKELWNEELRVRRIFTKNRTNYCVLKGLHLLKRLEKDYLSFKKVGDIDILINPRIVKKAFFLLMNLGYRYYGSPSYEDGELLFYNKKKDVWVEIHTVALDGVPSPNLDVLFSPLSDSLNREVTDKFLKCKEAIPMEYIVLEIITNFALKHVFRGQDKLKTVALLLAKLNTQEVERVKKMMENHRMEVYYMITLTLVNHFHRDATAGKRLEVKVTPTALFYRWLYLTLYPHNCVFNEYGGKQVSKYKINLNIIKIVCANQSIVAKIANILRWLYMGYLMPSRVMSWTRTLSAK